MSLNSSWPPVEKALGVFKANRDKETLNKLEKGTDLKLKVANQPIIVNFEVRPGDLARLLLEALEKSAQLGGVEGGKEVVAAIKTLEAILAKRPPKPDDDWVPLQVRMRPVEQALAGQLADRIVKGSDGLIVLKIQEGMMVWLEVSMICGLVLGSPWIFYQLWSFVGAGLYSTEKKLVHVYMPFSLSLFLCGVLLCEFVVIPQAVKFLLEFDAWLGVNAELRLEDWLSFALMMPVIFGLSFQTPLVMLFLAKIGIFDADSFRAKRRMAWFVLMVLAALLMPTTDPYAILMMQVPLIGLYEFGILLAAYVDRQRAKEEVPDPDEMVGV